MIFNEKVIILIQNSSLLMQSSSCFFSPAQVVEKPPPRDADGSRLVASRICGGSGCVAVAAADCGRRLCSCPPLLGLCAPRGSCQSTLGITLWREMLVLLSSLQKRGWLPRGVGRSLPEAPCGSNESRMIHGCFQAERSRAGGQRQSRGRALAHG